MATSVVSAPGLALPADTFAKLTPVPVFHAHLKANARRSGRALAEFRTPAINTGSLTHTNGSAVVRLGDTAVVCGVRAEILRAADMPRPPKDDVDEEPSLDELGLIVPNIELSTGCAPAYLPGSPPGTQAQSIAFRLNAILSRICQSSDLRILYDVPLSEDEDRSEPERRTVGYWTLYVDVLCMALDGNAMDAICLAAVAALQDTTLPKAWWDPDRESVLCSPLIKDSRRFVLSRLPLTCTFLIASTGSSLKSKDQAQAWLLSDPDGFEEGCCDEAITVTMEHVPAAGTWHFRRIEQSGGLFVNQKVIGECVQAAQAQCQRLLSLLKNRS